MTTNTPNPEQLKQLCELFPEADEEVCRAVYESHAGDLEASINAMLSITDPSYIPDEVPPFTQDSLPPSETPTAPDPTSVTSTSEQQMKADEELARALMAEEERQASQAQQANRPPLPARRSSSSDMDPTLQEIKEKINVFTDNTVKKIKDLYNRYLMPEYEDLYGQQMPSHAQYEQNTSQNPTGNQNQTPRWNRNESSQYNHTDFLEDPDDMRSASIIDSPFQNSTPPPPPPRNKIDSTGFETVSIEGSEPNELKDELNTPATKKPTSSSEAVATLTSSNTDIIDTPVSLTATEPSLPINPPETSAVVAPSASDKTISAFSAPEASAILAPAIPTLPEGTEEKSLNTTVEPIVSSAPVKSEIVASPPTGSSNDDTEPKDILEELATEQTTTATEIPASSNQVSSITEEFSKTRV
ncbi:hypothetical protein K493DRAFT_339952 [Basidiobolus meristosporus CBS 931.73]|uniref:CUE domain-containing protein n=1 Tax=Basidiobolus meristosporus CBS 931.73 TaxID=1314790 RepID=A0A1Y1XXR5_9FUNG|nr:hypothetical protein K493DRAFT_339952 [Basidiobolus meristosporus CBS 931.73]|eukprot:ORX90529.1 hypothetical protein K493DRAFT_339952 [Basidiobolus meristosporus CBS 931.73]